MTDASEPDRSPLAPEGGSSDNDPNETELEEVAEILPGGSPLDSPDGKPDVDGPMQVP